jgi:hypothetical protein
MSPLSTDTTGGGQVALVVNDQSLAQFGFVVDPMGISGLLDAASTKVPTGTVPGRPGAVRLALLPETEAREIHVAGHLIGTSIADLMARADYLKQWLARGGDDLEIRSGYDLTRFWRGALTGCVITGVEGQFYNPYATAELTFTCADPRAYGAEATVVGFGAQSRAPCPLGTAPSEPLIRLMGPASNPVITYRSAAGAVVGSHGFTIALGNAEFLEVSTPDLTVIRHSGGAASDAIALEGSGDFITLSPDDGDPMVGAWPTLETSSGTGEALWRKTYS